MIKRRITEKASMVYGSNAYAKANLGGEEVNVHSHSKLNNSLMDRNSRYIGKKSQERNSQKHGVWRRLPGMKVTLYSFRKDAEEKIKMWKSHQ